MTRHLNVLGIAHDALDAITVYGGPAGQRLGLEGRLLAGCPAEQVAQQMGLCVSTVRFYERTFFDVADRLDHPGFVVNNIIENRPYGGAYEKELLRVCLAGGPAVAEQLLLGFDPNAKKPTNSAEVDAFLHSDIKGHLRNRAVLAMRLLDVSDPKIALRLVRLTQSNLAQDQRLQGRHQNLQEFEEGAKLFKDYVRSAFEGTTPYQQALRELAARYQAEEPEAAHD